MCFASRDKHIALWPGQPGQPGNLGSHPSVGKLVGVVVCNPNVVGKHTNQSHTFLDGAGVPMR
eukprot:4318317-Amphidinium_carterae.1